MKTSALPTTAPAPDATIDLFMNLESSTDLGRGHYVRTRVVSVIAILLALAAFVQVAEAQQVTFPDRPRPGTYYVDEAGLISDADRAAINTIADQLWRDEQVPVFAVTIPSLSANGATDYTIERYASELFDHWGIGSRERNYGILLLVSEGDRQARIELGAAWGGNYDAQAQQIMDELIIQRFKEGRFSEGILFGVRGLDALARDEAPPGRPLSTLEMVLILAFLALSFAVIISLFRSGRSGWGWALIAAVGVILFFLLKVLSILAIFGGGSSGGGGASGDW